MSRAVPKRAGATYLVIRRTTQGENWLSPVGPVLDIARYCCVHAVRRKDCVLHTHLVLPNFITYMVTDPHGVLPQVTQWGHSHIARLVNLHYEREENLFSNAECTSIAMADAETALDTLAWVQALPTIQGMVPFSREWPGRPPNEQLVGGSLGADRPPIYFTADGKMPEREEIPLQRLPGFGHLTDAEYLGLVEEKVAAKERQARRTMKAEGKRFVGLDRAEQWTPEDKSEFPVIPKVECLKGRTIFMSLDNERYVAEVVRYQRWYERYLDARDWHRRDEPCVFPAGTYQYRERCWVDCESPPPGPYP